MSDAVASRARVSASATPAALQLGRGERAYVTVKVENRAPVVDQFLLVVEDLDAELFDLRVGQVSLFPGEAGELGLEIHLPADRFIAAGRTTVILRAVSRHDPSVQATVRLPLQVQLVRRVELTLRPAQVSTRSVGRVHAHLSNLGNSEQVLDLTIADPQDGLRARLRRDRVAIAPGAHVEVDIRLTPRRRPLHGFASYYPFTMAACALDQPSEPLVSANGVLVYRPPLGWLGAIVAWARLLARLLVVLLVGVGILLWQLGAPGERTAEAPQQAAQPAPASVEPSEAPAATEKGVGALAVAAASNPQAAAASSAQGLGTAGSALTGGSQLSTGSPAGPAVAAAPARTTGPQQASAGLPPSIISFDVSDPPAGAPPGLIQISWEARNVDHVTIGGAALPASGTALVQGLQEGEIELVARNAAGEARRSVGLLVLRPPEILEFTATPPNTDAGQLVTLAWRVIRAETLRVFGPGLDAAGDVVDPSQGTRQVRPTETATYTLRAENALGRVQESLPVGVTSASASATLAPTPTGIAVTSSR